MDGLSGMVGATFGQAVPAMMFEGQPDRGVAPAIGSNGVSCEEALSRQTAHPPANQPQFEKRQPNTAVQDRMEKTNLNA